MTLYMLFAALVMAFYTCAAFAGATATREPDSGFTLATQSRSALTDRESARLLTAGRTLFQERGCVGCHRPDGTGAGPTLLGLYGSPVQDPACGVAVVDESYLSEAILTPAATVAAGFLPIMPSFAGQLTEEELQALIVYLKSLGSIHQEYQS